MDLKHISSSSPARTRILSIGNDAALLRSRHMVLESEGHQVRSIPSRSATEAELSAEFDVVVLCHGLREERVKEITAALQRLNPRVRIVALTKFESGMMDHIGNLVRSAANPRSLLSAVSQLANRQSSALSPGHFFQKGAA
jgi:DNA-binding response OmpR family regulator